MPTTTWKTIRQRVLQEMDLGILIDSTFVTALDADSFTAPNFLLNPKYGAEHFSSRNTMIGRGEAATAADYERPAGTLIPTTGELANAGGAWSDVDKTNEDLELWYYGIRPYSDVMAAGNRALRYLFFDTHFALSRLTEYDGDMAVSTDTNWTNVGSPGTSAKDATARRTPFGIRNYHLINASANEGTRSATLGIRESDSARAFTIASVNAGPSASFQLYDITGSAAYGSAVTSEEEEPQLLSIPWTATPADCKEIALNMLGTASTSDIFWNMAWLYTRGNLRLNFPSYITEAYMAPIIFQGHPQQAGNSTNVYDAGSMEFIELVEGRDYKLLFNHHDANPYGAQFHDASAFDWPLFVQAKRPYSDVDSFTSDASTTKAPENLIVPATKLELLRTLIASDPGNSSYRMLFQQALSEWNDAKTVRISKSVAHRPHYGMPKA